MAKAEEGEKAINEAEEALTEQLDGLAIKDENHLPPSILVCDSGYGFPREKRPFQEKMNAITSQLANFLQWQTSIKDMNFAEVRVVGCPDEKTRAALQAKLLEKTGMSSLPEHVTIVDETLEECIGKMQQKSSADDNSDNDGIAVYLSPDADESLDPSKKPPRIAVVGLLIDRRVQPDRSKNRASKLDIVAKRWPLEDCFAEISAKEPLNVDCVMEGMQQWWWNCDNAETVNKECFIKAASQAIEHHAQRHPSRPLHVSK